MPWSNADYPASMKNLSPEVRRHAIEIANAILKDGGEEGTAIATAISRAKESSAKKGSSADTLRADVLKLAELEPISPDGIEDTGPMQQPGP